MPFLPEEPEDAFWFAVAPLTTGPVALYSVSAYVSGSYPYGKPDWAANARNAITWLAVGSSVYAWNYVWSPHNLAMVTGSSAFKTVGQVALHSMTPAMIAPLALAAPGAISFVGYRTIVESQPVEEQSSMWHTWIAALTGTGPGVGSWTP